MSSADELGDGAPAPSSSASADPMARLIREEREIFLQTLRAEIRPLSDDVKALRSQLESTEEHGKRLEESVAALESRVRDLETSSRRPTSVPPTRPKENVYRSSSAPPRSSHVSSTNLVLNGFPEGTARTEIDEFLKQFLATSSFTFRYPTTHGWPIQFPSYDGL